MNGLHTGIDKFLPVGIRAIVNGAVVLIGNVEHSLEPPYVDLFSGCVLGDVADCVIFRCALSFDQHPGCVVVNLPGNLCENIQRDRRDGYGHGVRRLPGNDDRRDVIVIVCLVRHIPGSGKFCNPGNVKHFAGCVAGRSVVVG